MIELFCVLVMAGNHTFVKTHQTVMQKGELYCVNYTSVNLSSNKK